MEAGGEKDVKQDYTIGREPSPLTEEGHMSAPEEKEHSLQRGLQSRQVTMIAIGETHQNSKRRTIVNI